MNKANQNSIASKPAFSGEKVRLGELIYPSKVIRCGSNPYPVLSMTMHDGIVMQAGRFKKAIASKDTSAYKVVLPGQLVVGFPIDEGVIYVQNFDEPGIMSPAYSVWDIDQTLVCPKYLELVLHGPQSMAYYSKKMRGTTARRRSITPTDLCALEILLPLISDQLEIVDVFRHIKDIERENTALIADLQTLVKSRFIEMFGDPVDNPKKWEKPALGKLFVIGSAKRVYAEEQVSEGVPFLRLGDLTNRIQSNAKSCDLYISEEKYFSFAKENLVPDSGDILVTARGTMGLCYEIKPDDKFYFQDGMITWLHRTPKSPLSAFVVHLFNNEHFIDDLHLNTSGTTVKYLSIKALSMLPAINPPLPLQQEFAAFARQAAKLEFVAQRQIEKLQLLYDSLAQEYFG